MMVPNCRITHRKVFSIQSFLIAKPKIFFGYWIKAQVRLSFFISILRSFSSFENKLVVVVVDTSDIGVKSKHLILSDLETNPLRT
jgi:hypothetical protein